MINICLLNISCHGSTTGVDRYLSVLTQGLQVYEFSILLIDFVYDDKIIFPKYIERANCKKIIIPLPQRYSSFLNQTYWMDKYFNIVIDLILPFLKEDMVYHVNSFNLILLALKLKHRLKGKIISHLHFIPWKEYYEQNKIAFNKLYVNYYYDKEIVSKNFFVNSMEELFYNKADRIICVTSTGKEFVRRLTDISSDKIEIITNGLEDYRINEPKKNIDPGKFTILFVGRVCEGKGIFFALEALNIVNKKGYNFNLLIAGACEEATKALIYKKYGELNINILDNMNFSELKDLYLSVNIGIMPSLKEQASYAAIEMAMFGLPLITSNVDGLDEIFTDNLNVLKVPTRFLYSTSLTIDVDILASKIISLIENKELCLHLSRNIRKLYEQKFTLFEMTQKTMALYNKLNSTRERDE